MNILKLAKKQKKHEQKILFQQKIVPQAPTHEQAEVNEETEEI
jgi:hypothetical protein